MLYVHGALNANSRKFIESWKSPLSNAKNRGARKNSAKPKKPKQTQLREKDYPAKESRTKLDVAKLLFQALKFL
jgi:hypothetical protein